MVRIGKEIPTFCPHSKHLHYLADRCLEQIEYMNPMHSGRIKCATRSDRSLDWGIYSPGSLPKKYFLRSDRSPNQGIYYPGSPPRKYFLMRLENPALLKRIKYLKTVTFGKYLWTYVNNDVWVSWGTTIGNIVLRNLIKKLLEILHIIHSYRF